MAFKFSSSKTFLVGVVLRVVSDINFRNPWKLSLDPKISSNEKTLRFNGSKFTNKEIISKF